MARWFPIVAERDDGACVGKDFDQNAVGRRFDLRHRLVGFDFQQGFALADRIAHLLEPGDDRGLGNDQVHVGHDDRHAVLRSPPALAAAARSELRGAGRRRWSRGVDCRQPRPAPATLAAVLREPTARRWIGGRPSITARAAATIFSALAMTASSSGGLNGCETGSVCNRPTGASSSSKACSMTIGRDFGPDAAHRVGFVDHQQPARLLHAGHDRFDVQRHDRPQVDHFARDALRGQLLGRLDRAVQPEAAGDDRQIGSLRARRWLGRRGCSTRRPAPGPWSTAATCVRGRSPDRLPARPS